MATYFISPYSGYYDTLNGMRSIASECDNITSKLDDSITTLNGLKSTISSSNWQEQGATEISSSTIDSLKSNVEVVKNNVNNSLKAACTIAINQLLPELEKLKEEDTNYDNIQTALNNLVVPGKYDSENNITQAYRIYQSNKNKYESEKNTSKNKCIKYQMNIDSYIDQIKAKNDCIENLKVTVSNGGGSSYSVIEQVEGGKLLKINYNGEEIYVANTRISVVDYCEYVTKYNITQNGGVLPALCAIMAQYYAMDMMRGTYTSAADMNALAKSPSTRINDTCESTDINDVYRYIYDELCNGRLTTLQVTQINTPVNGSRHVVTVVGFSGSVKSWQDLNEDTIYVLDCVDGEIQTLSKSRSDGGHERKLYAMTNGKGERTYLAHGATDDFLTLEVNNSNWQAKHGQSSQNA